MIPPGMFFNSCQLLFGEFCDVIAGAIKSYQIVDGYILVAKIAVKNHHLKGFYRALKLCGLSGENTWFASCFLESGKVLQVTRCLGNLWASVFLFRDKIAVTHHILLHFCIIFESYFWFNLKCRANVWFCPVKYSFLQMFCIFHCQRCFNLLCFLTLSRPLSRPVNVEDFKQIMSINEYDMIFFKDSKTKIQPGCIIKILLPVVEPIC